MQDEDFDNMDDLIREASESYHPVYDDKAWDKMLVLLDKHLPVKDDKKKPFVFFLLFLFLGTAISFSIIYPWYNNGKKVAAPGENKSQQNVYNPVSPILSSVNSLRSHVKPGKPGSIGPFLPAGAFKTHYNLQKYLPVHLLPQKTTKVVTEENSASDANSIEEMKSTLMVMDRQVVNNELKLISINTFKEPTFMIEQTTSHENEILMSIIDKSEKKDLKKTFKLTVNKTGIKDKNINNFSNKFAITISAGPALSFVGLNNLGKINLDYGAGLSYEIGNRLTLRSGFYVTQKVYGTNPADYHPPVGYWTYNANMQRVDADCRVYDIPLVASYHFRQVKKHNWIAGVGLSSYIMKSETYHYLFKNIQGQTMYRGWTLLNKNKHFFSVLTISGGYQYHLNDHLSIIAEPYLKLPLSGIGFGNIKLNSSGLMVTSSIKPFLKRK